MNFKYAANEKNSNGEFKNFVTKLERKMCADNDQLISFKHMSSINGYYPGELVVFVALAATVVVVAAVVGVNVEVGVDGIDAAPI